MSSSEDRAKRRAGRTRARTKLIKELQGRIVLQNQQLEACRLATGLPRETGWELRQPVARDAPEWTSAYQSVRELTEAHVRLRVEKDALDERLAAEAKAVREAGRRHSKTSRELTALKRGATLVRDALNLLLGESRGSSLLPLVVAGVGAMAAFLGGGMI